MKQKHNIEPETVATLTQEEYDRLLTIEQKFQFLKQQFEQFPISKVTT